MAGDAAIASRLGPPSKSVQTALRAVWNSAPIAMFGIPAPNLRKG
jgi:hypothetical protein